MDYTSWKFTQKLIRIGHNRAVRKHFADIPSDTQRNNGRAALKNGLLIKDSDSALEVLNKQLYFKSYIDSLSNAPIATFPITWETKALADRPQLVIIYRPEKKTEQRTGNYPIYLPHYNGNKAPSIPTFHKGSIQATLFLKDNSKIVVNGVTEEEARRVILILKQYVKPKYRTDNIGISKIKGRPYKEFVIKPIRADYYKNGVENATPTWRHYP